MIKIKDKVIFLFGYYGRNNIGDDLMLNNLLSIFEKKGVKKVFLVTADHNFVGNDITFELVLINGIKSNPLLFFKALLFSDLFIWGGGTCFFERENRRGLFELKYMLRSRVLVGKGDNYFLGIGLEPLTKSKSLVADILKMTKGVVFRDVTSLDLFNSYNFNVSYVDLLDDLVFHQNTLTQVNNLNKKDNDPYMTFSGHFKYGDAIAEVISENLKNFAIKKNLKIVFLPAKFGQSESDESFHNRVRAIISVDFPDLIVDLNSFDINSFVSCLKGASLHVGMRLHSIILADIFGIPNIAIAYQNKIYQYAPEAIDPEDVWEDSSIRYQKKATIENRIKVNSEKYDSIFR